MKKKDLLIVIPAYNEEENLGKVLEALAAPETSCHSDVLVINDTRVLPARLVGVRVFNRAAHDAGDDSTPAPLPVELLLPRQRGGVFCRVGDAGKPRAAGVGGG